MVSNFSKKGNKDFPIKKFWLQAGAIFFVMAIIALAIADFKIYQKKQELISKVESYKKKIEDIKESNQALQEEIGNSDNPEYLEKIAYEQGMVKKGEKAVVFLAPEQKIETLENKKSFWNNFTGWLSMSWGWIKSKF